MDIGFLTMLEVLDYLRGSDVIYGNFVPTKKSEGRYFIYILCRESVNFRNTKSFFFKVRKLDFSSPFFSGKVFEMLRKQHCTVAWGLGTSPLSKLLYILFSCNPFNTTIDYPFMNVWEHQRLWLLHNGPFRNFFSASPSLPFINDCELSFPLIAISLIQLFIPVDKLLAGCDTRLIPVLARRDVCSNCCLRYILHAWPRCSWFLTLFNLMDFRPCIMV
jgi:hypothetical protein